MSELENIFSTLEVFLNNGFKPYSIEKVEKLKPYVVEEKEIGQLSIRLLAKV